MNYFEIDYICEGGDPGNVCLDEEPEGIKRSWKLNEGTPMGDDYPPGMPPLRMSTDYLGKKLASFLRNVSSLIIVEARLKDALQATGVPMECLPFTLINHKGRVASRDYFIVNLLGSFDCLDLSRSVMKWDSDTGKLIDIKKLVLDPKKLEQAPPIFRVKEDPIRVLLSGTLVQALKELQPPITNLFLVKVEQ